MDETPRRMTRATIAIVLYIREARHDRRDHFHASVAHDVVRDPIAFTTNLHFIDDLIHRPDEDGGHLEHAIDRDANPLSLAHEPLGRLPAVPGYHHRADEAQLDVIEARTRLLPEPRDLLSDGFREEPRRVRDAPSGPKRRGLDPDDVGFARRDREHPLASRADQNGWVRPLNRGGKQGQILHRVEAAGERERRGAEEPLEDLERLHQTVDAHPGRVIRKSGRLVLRLGEAGPETKLEPAA